MDTEAQWQESYIQKRIRRAAKGYPTYSIINSYFEGASSRPKRRLR